MEYMSSSGLFSRLIRWCVFSLIAINLICHLFTKPDALSFSLLAFALVVVVLDFYAFRSPFSKLGRIMHVSCGGSRDVKHMTNPEFFDLCGRFFKLAGIVVFAEFALGILLGHLKAMYSHPIIIVGIAIVMIFIPIPVFFFGGLYLLIRGLHRKAGTTPSEVKENRL
jgi:hypothetical protein